MNVYCGDDYDQISRIAATIISDQIIEKPDSLLGLATGSSPIGAYKELVNAYKKGDLDFSHIHTVNLDEYKGIDKKNKNSYSYFMNRELFKHVNINTENTYIPDGTVLNEEKACNDYDEILQKAGTIDLQILGIGNDGHIGFNEPDTLFHKTTHCVQLSAETRRANARFFNDSIELVPEKAYTMGIQSIMNARKIILIVSGRGKAKIIKESFQGPVTSQVPASILQLHPNTILIGDSAALSEVEDK